jgi:hypothetical protein
LNALLCNFDAIGFDGFFPAAAEAYRTQNRTQRLRLGPFLSIAHRLSVAEGLRKALTYWYRTGGYVAHNAWQLAFAVDCARNRRIGNSPGEGPTPWLDRFDRRGMTIVTSAPGKVATALLTAALFYTLLALTWSERE